MQLLNAKAWTVLNHPMTKPSYVNFEYSHFQSLCYQTYSTKGFLMNACEKVIMPFSFPLDS